MTNGEKMQAVFSDIEMWGESKDTWDYSLGGMIHRVTKSWWNSEYKEPTPKNDLAVDAISRQAVIDELKRYFHDEYYQRTSIQDCRDCFIEDVLKHLPSVTPQEPRWILVSEKLPEYGEEVLTCSNGGFIEIQSLENRCDGYWENQKGDWSDLDEIIAWMPLLKPYEPQESEG